MITQLTQIVSSDSLYSGFWIDVAKISPYVCKIRETPHYAFAFEVLSKALKGEFAPVPEKSFYENYCKWESYCLGRNMNHSPNNFYKKIASWVKDFDILSNLPEVKEFESGSYYIYDGIHRISYMTVLIDISKLKDEIPVVLLPPEENDIRVEGIAKIEDWLHFK